MGNLAKAAGLALALSCAVVWAADQKTDTAPGTTGSAAQGSGTRVDNTRINVRDRDAASKTAQTQTNKSQDRKLLAAVRKAVTRDKSLSIAAHNVKILAQDGVVTLRGPVKSEDEKAKVEQLAQQIAGVSKVENQLDVKHN